MEEVSEFITGKTYKVCWDYHEPLVYCTLDERGVFMPNNPNTKGMFERIYAIYEC